MSGTIGQYKVVVRLTNLSSLAAWHDRWRGKLAGRERGGCAAEGRGGGEGGPSDEGVKEKSRRKSPK